MLQDFILKGNRTWIGSLNSFYFRVMTTGYGVLSFTVRIFSFLSSTHYFHPFDWKAVFNNWKQENWYHIKNPELIFFAFCSMFCLSALVLKQVQLLALYRSRCFYPVIVGLFFRAVFYSTNVFYFYAHSCHTRNFHVLTNFEPKHRVSKGKIYK